MQANTEWPVAKGAKRNAIGERIRSLRKEQSLTQGDVGKYLGVGKATVQKYECGVIENIPIGNLIDLCKVLRTSPNELLGWEEDECSEGEFDLSAQENGIIPIPRFTVFQKNEWNKFSRAKSFSTLSGYLYIVQIGDMVKIGKSINPYGRVISLKVTFENYGDKQIGLCAISEEHFNYTKNEKTLHKYFAKDRIPKTELFKADFGRVLREIENGLTGITIS